MSAMGGGSLRLRGASLILLFCFGPNTTRMTRLNTAWTYSGKISAANACDLELLRHHEASSDLCHGFLELARLSVTHIRRG
jgi:hypothetical protein